MARSSFGLILANRAVVLGAVKVADLLDLTAQAERSGFFDAVWAGDSLAQPGASTGKGRVALRSKCCRHRCQFAMSPPRTAEHRGGLGVAPLPANGRRTTPSGRHRG